jgi:alkyl hydroperoxide reductase subunit AhpF
MLAGTKGTFPLQNQMRKVRLNISRVTQKKKISFKLRRVLNVDIIKMDLTKNRKGSIERINLVQYRDKWQTPVNMVMNLQVP